MSEQAIPGTGGAPGPISGPVIFDVTDQTFMDAVIKKSMEVPVIVDFWAPWCGPCKQLTPALEKAVEAAGGTVLLAKVNIDEHQGVSGELGVQSVPTVIGFKDGRPMDGFVGAQPESQIKAFIERLAGPIGPSATEQLMEMADAAFAAHDYQQAAGAYAQIAQQEPENVDALAGLAQCYLGVGEVEQAAEMLIQIPEGVAATPRLVAVRAAIKLAGEAADAGPLADLQAAVDADPKNHQARFDLAVALLGSKQEEQAIEELLTILRAKLDWNDSAARKKLLEIFEMLGPTDPRTIAGRRGLSSLLFA